MLLTRGNDLGHLRVFTLQQDAHAILGFNLLGAHTYHRDYQNGIRLHVRKGELTVNVRNGSLLCSLHQDICAHQRLVVIGRDYCS